MNISHMSLEELHALHDYITELIIGKTEFMPAQTMHDCPRCGSAHVAKNGRVRGRQRYICRGCGQTFGNTTNTTMCFTRLSTDKWLEYAKCMINGYSIRKCAEIVEVTVHTSFYMRHRILDAIRKHYEKSTVGGLVELDETFIQESYKGNHKRRRNGFTLPRPARKRGKDHSIHGISHEQICVATAIDQNGGVVMEMLCKGRPTSKKLVAIFKESVAANSTICTDSYGAYKTVAKACKANHKRIPTGRHRHDGYSLANINGLHSRFKTWFRRFNGVATRHLPNYLVWFKWLEQTKDLKHFARGQRLYEDVLEVKAWRGIDWIRDRDVIWAA